MKNKKLSKALEIKLNRPIMSGSVHKEVNIQDLKASCLCCSRKFRAISRFSKICDTCKSSDKWKFGL